MMKTWDGTKASPGRIVTCTKCGWVEVDPLNVYMECPECSSKVHRYNVYICPYCNLSQDGVEQYNIHTLEHYECYGLLESYPDIVAAMKKYAPWVLNHTIRYFNEHGIQHNLGEPTYKYKGEGE